MVAQPEHGGLGFSLDDVRCMTLFQINAFSHEISKLAKPDELLNADEAKQRARNVSQQALEKQREVARKLRERFGKKEFPVM